MRIMSEAPTGRTLMDRRRALLETIVLSAGKLALEGFASVNIDKKAMKGRQDFLTETDGAVEHHLRTRIAEAFPEDGFLGEESGGALEPQLWVVDPIDGTANFARGVAHFCISVAFMSDGVVELGAIYAPGQDELYVAAKGEGATRNGKLISVAATTDFDRACVELGWSTRVPDEAYLDALGKILVRGPNVRRAGSGALGLAYVADGRSDAYAELHMQPWDCLAGLLLVREAGGVTCAYPGAGGLIAGGAVLASCPAIAAGISEATGIPIEP